MKSIPSFFSHFAIQCTALLTFAGALMAQGPTQVFAKVNDMKVIMQKTPVFTAAGVEMKKDGKLREWLELEIEFETKSDSEGRRGARRSSSNTSWP